MLVLLLRRRCTAASRNIPRRRGRRGSRSRSNGGPHGFCERWQERQLVLRLCGPLHLACGRRITRGANRREGLGHHLLLPRGWRRHHHRYRHRLCRRCCHPRPHRGTHRTHSRPSLPRDGGCCWHALRSLHRCCPGLCGGLLWHVRGRLQRSRQGRVPPLSLRLPLYVVCNAMYRCGW